MRLLLVSLSLSCRTKSELVFVMSASSGAVVVCSEKIVSFGRIWIVFGSAGSCAGRGDADGGVAWRKRFCAVVVLQNKIGTSGGVSSVAVLV